MLGLMHLSCGKWKIVHVGQWEICRALWTFEPCSREMPSPTAPSWRCSQAGCLWPKSDLIYQWLVCRNGFFWVFRYHVSVPNGAVSIHSRNNRPHPRRCNRVAGRQRQRHLRSRGLWSDGRSWRSYVDRGVAER